MIFGRIDYINLLPFYLFLKRFHPALLRLSLAKKGAPSTINRLFKSRKIDAGFISSIKSRSQKGAKLGIIARKAVTSVLVLENTASKDDSESDTSNALAKVLNLKGEVVIGDKALKLYLQGAKVKDLALEWQKKTGLPFAFARLCFTSHRNRIKQLEKDFLRRVTRRIPHYILLEKSQKTGIKPKDINEYLKRIDYKLDKKAEMALKKFLFITRQQRIG